MIKAIKGKKMPKLLYVPLHRGEQREHRGKYYPTAARLLGIGSSTA